MSDCDICKHGFDKHRFVKGPYGHWLIICDHVYDGIDEYTERNEKCSCHRLIQDIKQ